DRLAEAAGYRYRFDPRLGQYAHDTLIFAIDRQGQGRPALSGFTLDPDKLRSALVGGPSLPAAAFAPIPLICHGLAAEVGKWNGPVTAALRIGGLALLALLAAGLATTLVRRRQAR